MSLATYKQYKNEREETRKKMKKIGKDVVLEAAAEFFDKNPRINKIVWTQYTPHWNDGDVCEFRAYPYEDDDFYDEDEETSDPGVGDDPKWYEKVDKFLGLFEDEDLEEWFDNGSLVTISRTAKGTKLKIEEYEHD